MTTAALPQHAAPDASPFSLLSSALADVGPRPGLATSASPSVTFDLRAMDVAGELDVILAETGMDGWDGYGAAALSAAVRRPALRFLALLPSTVPVPEISPSPEGAVAFEWTPDPQRRLSVAVSASGRLVYASLVGPSRQFGTETLADELPATIRIALQRVLATP